jgi:hypothetical protein
VDCFHRRLVQVGVINSVMRRPPQWVKFCVVRCASASHCPAFYSTENKWWSLPTRTRRHWLSRQAKPEKNILVSWEWWINLLYAKMHIFVVETSVERSIVSCKRKYDYHVFCLIGLTTYVRPCNWRFSFKRTILLGKMSVTVAIFNSPWDLRFVLRFTFHFES